MTRLDGGKRRGLRLPLARRQDPVLTEDELDSVALVLQDRIDTHERVMARTLVSESVIREKLEIESALAKINEAQRSYRR